MKRESFKSRLGFLLVSAGCAIGIGNVWRFPYVAGQNGGGFFVLLYLIFLVSMGLPVLTMELAVGRASRKSAVMGYKALEKPGSKWHIHGWFCILGCYVLMMYYTTVCGWMISYFFKFLTGEFKPGMNADQVGAVFGGLLASPGQMGAWMAVSVVAGFFVCSKGLQNGLEKISKFMMVALMVLILVLAVHSLVLPGAGEGLKFYLVPSVDKIQEVGIRNVVTAAMNQAFFTLSLGIAAMEIFGSYMSKDHTLPGEAASICGLDTFVALMAGLIIIPACFAFNVEPGAGPGLVFITLPNVFNQMAGGRLWGALFFLFMSFAALSTVIAVFENILSFAMDLWGWKRNKAVLFNIVLIIILSMPAILGFGPWSGVQILGEGTNIMDLEDFIISNNILPLGSVIFVIFCASKNGWGWDNFIREANTGKGMKFPAFIRNYMLWVIPIVVAIIYLKGYYDMFQPKGNTYLIPWMIVGIAMLILVGWIVFGHSKKNKK